MYQNYLLGFCGNWIHVAFLLSLFHFQCLQNQIKLGSHFILVLLTQIKKFIVFNSSYALQHLFVAVWFSLWNMNTLHICESVANYFFIVGNQIIPEKCKYLVLSTKVEIRLAKAEQVTWTTLDYSGRPKALPQKISTPGDSFWNYYNWSHPCHYGCENMNWWCFPNA